MNWRTDKPTADLIIAKFGNRTYEVLYKDKYKNEYYYIDLGQKYYQPINNIEKWADLEEDETVTDINEIQRKWWNKGYLEGRKNAHIPARELGLPKEYDVFNKTVTDCDQLKDPITKHNAIFDQCIANCNPETMQKVSDEVDLENEVVDYFQGHWPGIATPEQCNTDMHFTPLAILRLAKHFAKWGKKKEMERQERMVRNYMEGRES